MAPSDSAERFADEASRRGLEIDVQRFPEGTKTAEQAAQAVGCDVSAIVKSLVFMVDDQPVVVLVPGDKRLDPAKLAAVAGAREIRRASPEEVREATGFAIGGTPPFCHRADLRVFADKALGRNQTLWAAAGTPTTVFPIAYDDLLAASGAHSAEIS